MLTIPTTEQLYDSIITDIETAYGITLPAYGRNFLRAEAWVLAGQLKLFYLAIGDVQKNIFADTADPAAAGGTLERFGLVKIGRLPYPATSGVYTASVTGTSGATIPASTTFISDDNSQSPGLLFIVDTAYTLPAPTGSITLRALTAGTSAQLAVGNTLTATAPIIGVNSTATVTAVTTAPVDAETSEAYRRVVLQSYRLYPQGGAAADYRLWGLDAAGVQQIYPYAASGAPNEVNVFVEAKPGDSTDGMGTPTTTILNEVADDIETDPDTGQGRRPLAVFAVNVLPVVINKLQIEIYGGGFTAAQQTLINAAITEAVNATRPFIPGADTLAERRDTFGVNDIIVAALNVVPGAPITTVNLYTSIGLATPVLITAQTYDNGNIPYLTSIFFG